jgi:hypothetical protein
VGNHRLRGDYESFVSGPEKAGFFKEEGFGAAFVFPNGRTAEASPAADAFINVLLSISMILFGMKVSKLESAWGIPHPSSVFWYGRESVLRLSSIMVMRFAFPIDTKRLWGMEYDQEIMAKLLLQQMISTGKMIE